MQTGAKGPTILEPMSSKPRNRKSTLVRTLALGVPIIFILTGCSSVPGLGFTKGLSSVNDTSLPLWQGAWITAGVVGIFTAGLILWSSLFHRKKDDEFPKQKQYHIPIEVAYTIIPLIIVAILFAFTARDESRITSKIPSKVMHGISINAMRWSWQFSYPEAGKSATTTGTPQNPPVLYMPQGERVAFTLNSSDVVHGFWIPAFMIQIQNLPGVTNHLEFTANKLGDYPGRCNILCGRDHSRMLFTVRVVTPAQYTDYINSLKAAQ